VAAAVAIHRLAFLAAVVVVAAVAAGIATGINF